MSNLEDDWIIGNDECEGENVRNQEFSAKYCTTKQIVVGNTQK